MTKTIRKIGLAILAATVFFCLALALVFVSAPSPAYAEAATTRSATVSSWGDLQSALDSNLNSTVTLGADISAGSSGRLSVTKGAVTLDLNGYIINRGLSSASSWGQVFLVQDSGHLTITDSNPNRSHSGYPSGGIITGGKAGTVDSDAKQSNGGGILVRQGGKLTLSGGTIYGNSTVDSGGGVFVTGGGTFTMNGGAIKNNTFAVKGGGVCIDDGCTASLNGGTISSNSTTASGAGIFGAGVYNWGTDNLSLSGGITITGNTVRGYASNLYVQRDKKFKITGNMSGTVGIYTEVDPYGSSYRPSVATASSSSYINASRFTADRSGFGFKADGTNLLAVQTARVSFVLPSGVSWKSGYSVPTYYFVGDGLSLPTASDLNKPADTADYAYELSLWYANSSYTGTRYSQISASETSEFTLYAKLTTRTKVKLDTAAQTFTYDGNPHAFELKGTHASLTDYTIEYSSDGGRNYTSTAPTNAGSYYVRIQRSSDNTYADYYEVISNAVVIEKAALTRPTLTADMTYTYNGSQQTVSIDDLDRNTMTVTGDTGTDAQNYTVQITPKSNYKWTTGTENETITLPWTINKASFTPSITQNGWTYGGEAKSPVITDVIGTQTPVYHYSGTSNDGTYNETDSATAPTVAGSYSLYLTYADNDNTYEATSNTVNFTIARATLQPSITITDWTYGQTPNSPIVEPGTNPSGAEPVYLYHGETAAGANYSSNSQPTQAGMYNFDVTIPQTGNYNLYSDTNVGVIRVEQIELTLDWGATEYVWNGTERKPAPSISNSDAILSSDSSTVALSAVTVSSPIEPGNYTANVGINNANYKLTNKSFNYSIVKAEITPTVEIEGWTYGGAAKTPTVNGNTENGTETFYYTGRNGTNYLRSTTVPTDAGDYTVEAEIAATAHYNEKTAQAFDFTISPKTIEIVWTPTDANHFVYDGSDQKSKVTASYLDKDGNAVDLTVSGGEFKNVVAAGVEFTASFKNGETNYALPTVVAKTYVMQKRAVEIKAKDFDMYYGDAVPSAMDSHGWDYKAGTTDANKFVAADNVDFAVTTNANGQSNAGGVYYTRITQRDFDNYTVTYADGVMTVNKRQITVTIADKTSIYGDARVELTADITSGELKNSDANPWTLDCNVNGTTSVGPYNITGTPTNDNYDVTFAGSASSGTAGTYTVTVREITVTIADKTSVYGDARVDLTASVTTGNLVNNDADPWTLACNEVTVTTGIGTYDISGTATDNNYDVTFAGSASSGTKGVYTVTARPITVTIADKTSVYGDAQVGLTASVTSGELVNNDANPWTLACDVTATSAVGKYKITGTATNDNYSVTFANETNAYEVTPATITEVSVTGYDAIFDTSAHDAITDSDKSATTVNSQTITWKYKTTEDGEYAETMPQFTNADTYTVYYEITAPNHNAYTGSFEVKIAKKSLDKPALTDKTYTYDKTEQTAELNDKFDGALMTVTENRRTKAGTQNVTVTLKDAGNYKWTDSDDASFTIAWTIEKAVYDMGGVTFADKTVNENATAQTITITGALPEGVTVSYKGGNQIEPGVYTVTASFAGDAENYEAIPDITATLTIRATEIVYEKGDGENKEQSVVVEITSGMDPDVKLSIIDLQKDEATKVEVKRGDYGRIAQAYDVKFVKDSTTVQPDGTVTVRLLIDESMRSRNDLKVYYIDADGNVTDMNATRDGDYLMFNTTHFSTYAVAFTGLLGWEIALIVIFSIVFLLLLYVLIFFLLYKKGKLPGDFWDKFFFPLRKLFGEKAVLATACAGSGVAYQASVAPAPKETEADDVADETAATVTEDEPDEEPDEEAEETNTGTAEAGFPNIQPAPFTLSFTARLIQANDDLKKFYSAVKNELLAYGMKSSIRETGERFRGNKKALAQMAITGKTLKLYLALDPATIDKTSGAKKVSAKKYEAVPCMIRVRNPLSLKKTLALIKRVAEENNLVKDANYAPHDFAADYPYEPIEALIERGLAKDNRLKDEKNG